MSYPVAKLNNEEQEMFREICKREKVSMRWKTSDLVLKYLEEERNKEKNILSDGSKNTESFNKALVSRSTDELEKGDILNEVVDIKDVSFSGINEVKKDVKSFINEVNKGVISNEVIDIKDILNEVVNIGELKKEDDLNEVVNIKDISNEVVNIKHISNEVFSIKDISNEVVNIKDIGA